MISTEHRLSDAQQAAEMIGNLRCVLHVLYVLSDLGLGYPNSYSAFDLAWSV